MATGNIDEQVIDREHPKAHPARMNRYQSAVVVLVLFTLALPSRAQDIQKISGNKFLEVRSSLDKPTDRWNELDFSNSGLCLGFVLGLNEGVSLSSVVMRMKKGEGGEGSMEDLGVCVPSGGTTGQNAHIAMKYIRQNPERSHLPAATLIVEALQNAFPCGRKPAK